MKGKGTRKYKSYRLCSNAEKDKRQRQNAKAPINVKPQGGGQTQGNLTF